MVHRGVTCGTECSQVLLGVVACLAAELFVVNFQFGHRAARLASPAISSQHLVAELFVQSGVKPQSRLFWSDTIHDAFSAKWSRNVFLASPGRNLKKRKIDCKRTWELPFSRFAPARKSAQIISRQ